MTKAFENRVAKERIVDTKSYRYIHKGYEIVRINIDLLDTTAAYDKSNYEVVKSYR